jgi:hypothetical protein
VSEIIRWPIRIWIALFALNISIVLAVGVALSDTMILVLFLGLTILTIYSSLRTTLRIDVDQDYLRVGKARIERKYISHTEFLDEPQMRKERGALLNPKAYLALRFWIKTGIKVYISDERDPTPYWLISSRNGAAIKRYLDI